MFNLNDSIGVRKFVSFIQGRKDLVYFKVEGEGLKNVSFDDFVKLSFNEKQEVANKIQGVINTNPHSKTIHKLQELRNNILYSQSPAPGVLDNVPVDVLKMIAIRTEPRDICAMSLVCKKWKKAATRKEVIQAINKQRLKLRGVLSRKTLTKAEIVRWIIEAQNNGAELTHADFRGFARFSDEDYQNLVTHCPNIHTLFLYKHRNITPQDAKLVAQLQHVKELELLSDLAGVQEIAAMKQVTTLNLSGSEIGDDGAQVIADKMQQVTTLILNGNRIGDAGAQAIAGKMRQVKELNLETNIIGLIGVQAISEMQHVEFLDLSANRLGDESAQFIAKMRQVTTLNLFDNDIGDEGVRAIADKMRQVTKLNLGYNNIGPIGAQAIAAEMQQLTTLYIHGNLIDGVTATAIVEMPRLTALNLESNPIDYEIMHVLEEKFKGTKFII